MSHTNARIVARRLIAVEHNRKTKVVEPDAAAMAVNAGLTMSNETSIIMMIPVATIKWHLKFRWGVEFDN